MSVIETIKAVLTYIFANRKYQMSKMLFLCTVDDCSTFGLPW